MLDYIVTGSDGFLGNEVIKQFSKTNLKTLFLTSKEGDILNKKFWNQLPQSKNLIHLASKTNVTESWLNINKFVATNFMGTQLALDWCIKNQSKFIFASSSGCKNDELNFNEVSFSNPYILSKSFSENLIKFYVENLELDAVIFRIFNIYGSNQNEKFLIPTIVKQIKNNKVIKIENLTPKRDFIHVKDVARALIRSHHLKKGYKLLDLGTEKEYSVGEVIKIAQDISGTNLKVIELNKIRKNEILKVKADIKATKLCLNWSPCVELKEGLFELFNN